MYFGVNKPCLDAIVRFSTTSGHFNGSEMQLEDLKLI